MKEDWQLRYEFMSLSVKMLDYMRLKVYGSGNGKLRTCNIHDLEALGFPLRTTKAI